MTFLQDIRAGKERPEVKEIVEREGASEESLIQGISEGWVVVPRNVKRSFPACGIGWKLHTKVNANIGTSPDCCDIEREHAKLDAVLEAKGDTVMDLSTGGDLRAIRQELIDRSPIPFGTVQIYEMAKVAFDAGREFDDLDTDTLFEVIEGNCDQGVDFITVHTSITMEGVEILERNPRLMGIVSRGGSLIAAWMKKNRKENPLYANFDRLLDIVEKYDVTLSLGDGLRPGCQQDAVDKAQIHELIISGDLVRRARERGVQVMVEGPGHIPIDKIQYNMQLEKALCDGAPFYVLGPLPTDVAPGYDHIASCVGGAIAAWAGADFLCYVTQAEHLSLPTVEQVREGVLIARLAAHIGDIGKNVKGALDWDNEISAARSRLDWETHINKSLDPALAMRIREAAKPGDPDLCSMCGEFCAIRTSRKAGFIEKVEGK
jgi:phosphomethylpyrimidine synthase